MYQRPCYRVRGMLQGEHYETLALFVVYFVLEMFKKY